MQKAVQLKCGTCQDALRRVSLSGHYKKRVEIDVCERCALIWFEGIETAQLAGPGVIDLVRLIHAARPSDYLGPLPGTLACPECNAGLREIRTQTRFGRTKQMHCPQGHGYFQTFILYLAEKGFLRPIAWPDVKRLAGRTLFCAGCGAGMQAQAQLACPYCRSNVGLVDPSRLASAVDIEQAAVDELELLPLPRAEQMQCWSCGASVDPSQHAMCPQCHSPLKRKDTHQAVAAVSRVEALVRQNYEQQLPKVSLAKLQAIRDAEAARNAAAERRAEIWRSMQRTVPLYLAPVLILAVVAAVFWGRHEADRDMFPNRDANSAQVQPAPAPVPAPPKSMPAVQRAVAASPADSAYDAGKPGQPTMEQMFSLPAMQCESDAASRTAVKISQITIVPGASESAANASLDDMRTAYKTVAGVREHLQQGGNFAHTRAQFNDARGGGEAYEGKFLKRGELPRVLDRAAFCLPKGELSPVLRTQSGFHLLQVLEVR